MTNPAITAQMIVKNEDQFVYFAVKSVLPYVSQFLITDTGSSDQTVSRLRALQSAKIVFRSLPHASAHDITLERQRQLSETRTDWFWLVDGDEIYPEVTAREVLAHATSTRAIVAVRRLDCLGDLYHAQAETVGTYNLFGERGHLVMRLFNRARLPHLALRGDYPLEGYYYGDNQDTRDLSQDLVYITKSRLFHTAYLRRSSLGKELPMLNRHKYKYELGRPHHLPLPEVCLTENPFGLRPAAPRPLSYLAIGSLLTPLKQFKRALWRL